MSLRREKSVAGVQIPDSALAIAAIELLEQSSPDVLVQHCLRTYVFGSLATKAAGRTVADVEAAFCGAILHDLGLVPPYRNNRFEIDGADAAREFCAAHNVPPERAELVWQSIALHTSKSIADRMTSEIALCHIGATVELLGFGLEQFPNDVVQQIIDVYPRLNFKAEFYELIVQHSRRNPAAQILTWTEEVARSAGCTLGGQPLPTASQLMLGAPFEE